MDEKTFQHIQMLFILEEVIKIYDFNAAVYVNIVDYDTLFLSDFIFDAVTFEEDELFEFLNNELYAWHQEEGPYISNFKDYSVVGVPFQNFTWGVFLSINTRYLPILMPYLHFQTVFPFGLITRTCFIQLNRQSKLICDLSVNT